MIHVGQQLGIRESRLIQGRYVLVPEDLVKGTAFADRIAAGSYPVDIHSPSDESLVVQELEADYYFIPFRALLPRRTRNLLLAGRCISATHEACAAIRVSPIAMAIGEAAGIAAALALQHDVDPCDVDPAEIQSQVDLPPAEWGERLMAMDTGIAYFVRNRRPDVARADMEEIKAAGCSYVVHFFTEFDQVFFKQSVAEIVQVTKEAGLQVYIDPWSLGGFICTKYTLFPLDHPEACQVWSDGRPLMQACPNHPAFRDYMRRWLDDVVEIGGEVVFWDEPHLAVQKDEVGRVASLGVPLRKVPGALRPALRQRDAGRTDQRGDGLSPGDISAIFRLGHSRGQSTRAKKLHLPPFPGTWGGRLWRLEQDRRTACHRHLWDRSLLVQQGDRPRGARAAFLQQGRVAGARVRQDPADLAARFSRAPGP